MFDQEEEDDIEEGGTSVHFSRKFSMSKNSKLEDLYYICNCSRLCSSTTPSFGWLSPRPGGRRQPIEMKTLQRWVLTLFILASLVIVLMLWTSSSGSSSSSSKSSLRLTFDLDELTERHKCPACFGVNLCPQMLGDKIKLSDWTKYSITKLMNQKNTYYAEWNYSGVTRNVISHK